MNMILFFPLMVSAQEKASENFTDPKIVTIEIYGQPSFTVGDNYIGEGVNNGHGYGIRSHVFVYKSFYLGAAAGIGFYDIANTSIAGNYDRFYKLDTYMYVGYEYGLYRSWNASLDLGIGYSENQNRQSEEQGNARFSDSGTLFRLAATIEYEINSTLGVFLTPNYEYISTRIESSPLQGDLYDRGTYFNLGIGLRINIR